jgi:hypothetical protein
LGAGRARTHSPPTHWKQMTPRNCRRGLGPFCERPSFASRVVGVGYGAWRARLAALRRSTRECSEGVLPAWCRRIGLASPSSSVLRCLSSFVVSIAADHPRPSNSRSAELRADLRSALALFRPPGILDGWPERWTARAPLFAPLWNDGRSRALLSRFRLWVLKGALRPNER